MNQHANPPNTEPSGAHSVLGAWAVALTAIGSLLAGAAALIAALR